MNQKRLVAIVRRWIPLLLASVLLAAGAGYIITGFEQKVYEAKTTLIVGESLTGIDPDYTQLLVSQRLAATYMAVATRRPILEAVIEDLGLDTTAEDLAGRVTADAPPDGTLLTITAQDPDAVTAAAIANGIGEQLVVSSTANEARRQELQVAIDANLETLQTQITQTQAQIDTLTSVPGRTALQEAELADLQERLVTLQETYASLLTATTGGGANLITVIDAAVPPSGPISPKPLVNALLAGLVGLLIAAGIIALVEYSQDSISDPDEVRDATALDTLGSIASISGGKDKADRLVMMRRPRAGVSEAYRTLRDNVIFATASHPIRTLLVTSAAPGEGKTTTAINLALSFAQAGRRVILIDADLRRPSVHGLLNIPNGHGLTDLLLSDTVGLEDVLLAAGQPNLRVLPAGPTPANPGDLLGSPRMRELIDKIKQKADLVLFDSTSLQAVTDSASLSSIVDGTLLVVDATRGRGRSTRAACAILERAGAYVLGVVLNRANVHVPAEHVVPQGVRSAPPAS